MNDPNFVRMFPSNAFQHFAKYRKALSNRQSCLEVTYSKSVVKTLEKYHRVTINNSNKKILSWCLSFKQGNVIALNLMDKYLFKVNIKTLSKTSVDDVLVF